jgi:peptidoglycan/xylan/chitin deacetylase (PgdA/CDA1 family)
VLTYHGVAPARYESIDAQLDGNLVSEGRFREQLVFLQRNYRVIHPEQFRSWLLGAEHLPDRAVLLTCDDGLKSCLSVMALVLRSFDLSCLFFVTGMSLDDAPGTLWHDHLWLALLAVRGHIRIELAGEQFAAATDQQKRKLWWQLVCKISSSERESSSQLLADIGRQLQPSPGTRTEAEKYRLSLMNLEDLRSLLDSRMSIGAHTLSHPVLSSCDENVAWNEIAKCKQLLEASLKTDIWAMSYPFGDPQSVGARERQMARDAGFECAFLNCEGCISENMRFALPRVHMTRDMQLPEFAARLSGVHHGLKKVFAHA